MQRHDLPKENSHTPAVYRMPVGITEWPRESMHMPHSRHRPQKSMSHNTRRVPDARRDHGMAKGRHAHATSTTPQKPMSHNTCHVPDARKDHGMANETGHTRHSTTQHHHTDRCRVPDAREDHGLANEMTCTTQHHPTQTVYRTPAGITEWPQSHRHSHDTASHKHMPCAPNSSSPAPACTNV
jgi:hypothetical protein